jgi:hypothetical protein
MPPAELAVSKWLFGLQEMTGWGSRRPAHAGPTSSVRKKMSGGTPRL